MINYDETNNEIKFSELKQMLMDYWKNIAINQFEWKGLEEISESLTSEIIEEQLYEYGKSIFFNDKLLGYMALKATTNGKLNVYGKPTKYRAVGIGYNKAVDEDDGILIKNNTLGTPTSKIIDYYTTILADIELAKDVERNTHKLPIMLECTTDTFLTAKNIFKKINANEPAIFKNKSRGENEVGINVVDTKAPFYLDKLEDEYHNYEARILTALGIDNYVEDKAERVQTAEVESQQEYIIASFRASLESRKKACEKINKMFGLNLSVDYVQKEQIETDEQIEENDEVENNE